MQHLRARKRECRRARRALERRSFKGSLLNDEHFRLIREHNRLRRALLEKREQQRKAAEERRFRQDPYAYSSKLFEKAQVKGS